MADDNSTALVEPSVSTETPPADSQDTKAVKGAEAAKDFTNVSQAFYELLSEGRGPAEKKLAERKKAEVEPKPDATTSGETQDQTAPKVEPKKESPKRRPRASVPEIDPVAIASRAAAETADRMAERFTKKEEPKADKAPDFETVTKDLAPDQKRHMHVLREMEELYPDKYKGITSKNVEALSQIEQYTKTWQKENPGKKFDADDDEHKAFFDIVEPDFDEADYYDAVAALRVKPFEKLSKKLEATEEELTKWREERESQAIAPEIQKTRMSTASDVIAGLDPKILEAPNDQALIDMAEADPIGARTAIEFASQAAAVMGVASAILDGKGRIPIDERAPEVGLFFDMKNQFERELKSLPIQDQYDDQGRRFATWEEFARIAAKNPEETNKYWILDKAKLKVLVATEFVAKAKKEISKRSEDFEKVAKAKGFSRSNASNGTPKPKPSQPVLGQQKEPPATPPPAAGRTPIGTTANNDKAKTTDWRDNLLANAFPRINS